jgi:hypothetical protein
MATVVLKLKHSFGIRGRGMVLIPILPSPSAHFIKPIGAQVVVRRSDGTYKEFVAHFQVEHFSLVGGGSQWSIVVIVPSALKSDVSDGSELLVNEDVLAKVRHACFV